MYALHLYSDNRIHSACGVLPGRDYGDAPIVDTLPDGNLLDYLYVNGEYVYDPLPEPEPSEPETPAEEPSVWDELDAAYREGVNSV